MVLFAAAALVAPHGAVGTPLSTAPVFLLGPARFDPRTVVALGDSVPAGAACSCSPYPVLVAKGLSEQSGHPVRVDDLARGGSTTGDVMATLAAPTVAAAVSRADVVILTVGANDLPTGPLTAPGGDARTVLARYAGVFDRQRRQLSALVTRLRAVHTGRPGVVLVTGYWSVFLDGARGRAMGADYVARSALVTRAENRLIAAAAQGAGATYVDVWSAFKGDGTKDDTALLAPDGDHPDAAGHALLAQVLLTAVRWCVRTVSLALVCT